MRRPRLETWVGTGAVAGVVVALLLAVSTPPGAGYSRRQVALYLALVLGIGGAIVLGGVAAFLDARVDRRHGTPTTGRADDAATEPAAAEATAEEGGATADEADVATEAREDEERAEPRAQERSAGGRPPAP